MALVLLSCNGNGGKNGKSEMEIKEVAKLKSISLNATALNDKEFKEAATSEGCSKEFGSDITVVSITTDQDADITAEISKSSISLTTEFQTVTIKAKRGEVVGTTYTLKLKKARNNSPNPQEEMEALLKEIRIGEGAGAYKIEGNDLLMAKDDAEGCTKDMKNDFMSPAKIVAIPNDPTYSIVYNPESANTTGVELSTTTQHVTITVKKEGMKTSVYKLHISRGKYEIAPNPFKNLVVGEGDYKVELSVDDIKKATADKGLTVNLKSSAPEKIKVKYELKQQIYSVTSTPADLNEVELKDNKAIVKIVVTALNKPVATYTLNIIRAK